MGNEQNLTQKGKPLDPERARRLGRLSGAARREKARTVKSAREFARAALNAEVKDKETGKTFVVKDAMIRKLIGRALSETDLNAIKYLLELIGESPADENAKAPDSVPTDIKSGVDIGKWIEKEIEQADD